MSASNMSETLAKLPPGASDLGPALALELSDKNHGSAAGSVARTSTDAAQGAQRHDSPLGPGIGGDMHDGIPAGKRRVVSREPPAPLLESFLRRAERQVWQTALSISAPTTQCQGHSLSVVSPRVLRPVLDRPLDL